MRFIPCRSAPILLHVDHVCVRICLPVCPCMSIDVFYHNTARDVVTVLLIFAKYLSLYLHIFTCTYKGTHTQAHMYNQHTRGMATTRHRSLVGRSGGRGFVRDRPSKKKIQHTEISNLKRFEQIELQAKLPNYFLGSNKSNINQYYSYWWTLHNCCRVVRL